MKRKLLAVVLGTLWAESALGCSIYPNHRLHRAQMVSPAMVNISSGPNQFAGRTTLSSGSTSVTVSTFSVNSDSLIHLTPQVALVGGYTVQGRVAIGSGTSTGTASTTAIYSGDVVHLTWETPNNITSGQALAVDSIVGGVSFAIRTSNGLTTVASGAVAMWRIFGKEPAGLKVNSIGVGHFIVGWADGQARPVDVTAIWEIRRTS